MYLETYFFDFSSCYRLLLSTASSHILYLKSTDRLRNAEPDSDDKVSKWISLSCVAKKFSWRCFPESDVTNDNNKTASQCPIRSLLHVSDIFITSVASCKPVSDCRRNEYSWICVRQGPDSSSFYNLQWQPRCTVCRARLKRDDTRVETRFGLSAKRTSPFKSAGVGASSVDCWQPRCAHQR